VVVIGGLAGPAILAVAAVILPATWARVLPAVLRASVLLTAPVAISAVLVNVLFFPGGQEILLRLGPITATREGLVFALEVVLRLLVISGAISLFYLTTRVGDLTLDLERRGVSPRVAFVASASAGAVPAMLDRATTIIDAQRARGLDTEGSVLARLRGLVPVVGPVILGSIAEVEERTLALEARGFGHPGRRTLLWAPPDSPRQAVARWLMVAVIPLLIVVRSVVPL